MAEEKEQRYDPAAIEPKWQQRWAADPALYAAEAAHTKPKYYVLGVFHRLLDRALQDRDPPHTATTSRSCASWPWRTRSRRLPHRVGGRTRTSSKNNSAVSCAFIPILSSTRPTGNRRARRFPARSAIRPRRPPRIGLHDEHDQIRGAAVGDEGFRPVEQVVVCHGSLWCAALSDLIHRRARSSRWR